MRFSFKNFSALCEFRLKIFHISNLKTFLSISRPIPMKTNGVLDSRFLSTVLVLRHTFIFDVLFKISLSSYMYIFRIYRHYWVFSDQFNWKRIEEKNVENFKTNFIENEWIKSRLPFMVWVFRDFILKISWYISPEDIFFQKSRNICKHLKTISLRTNASKVDSNTHFEIFFWRYIPCEFAIRFYIWNLQINFIENE